jgi:hypothetical protein
VEAYLMSDREAIVELEATHIYVVRISLDEDDNAADAKRIAEEALSCGDVRAEYEEIESLKARHSWIRGEPCNRSETVKGGGWCSDHLSSIPAGQTVCYRRVEIERSFVG